jgi:methionyl-tRNA formyltransferase
MDLEGALLKVHRARAEPAEAEVGERLIYQAQPAVGTGNGILILDEVQPGGKKPMSGQSFLAGARNWA